jgi:hypothetical protein
MGSFRVSVCAVGLNSAVPASGKTKTGLKSEFEIDIQV